MAFAKELQVARCVRPKSRRASPREVALAEPRVARVAGLPMGRQRAVSCLRDSVVLGKQLGHVGMLVMTCEAWREGWQELL